MAKLLTQFNANLIDPTQGGAFKQLPLGKHPVVITASEVKATKDATGGYVAFELLVIEGPEKGAEGTMRINLYSSSPKACAVAESQMSALCHATGQFIFDDTLALHNKPFAVDVVAQALTQEQEVKKANGESVTPFTQVSKILDINGNEPGRPQGNQAAAPAPSPAPAPAPAAQAWAAPAQAPAQQGAWGGGGQAAAPAQAPAQAGWQQGTPASGGGAPAWGKR